MPHYLIGTVIDRSAHAKPFDPEPLNKWFCDRKCRTIYQKSGYTYDLIETPDSLAQVQAQLSRFFPEDESRSTIHRWVSREIPPDQIPAGTVDGYAWVNERGDLGIWSSTLPPSS